MLLRRFQFTSHRQQPRLISFSTSLRFSSSSPEEPFIPDFSQSDSTSSSSNNNNKNITRSTGKVTKWVDDKGFGFVNLQGKSLFVHARELNVAQNSPKSLKLGQTVEFTVGSQADGRLRATKVSQVGGKPLGEKQSDDDDAASGDGNDKTFSSDAFDLGEDEFTMNSSQQQQPKKKTFIPTKKTAFLNQQKEGKSSSKSSQTRDKLFSSYQWNCVESGNPSVEGFKVTSFPTNPQGNHEIPVPDKNWNDADVTEKSSDEKKSTTTANTSNINVAEEEAKIKASLPPPPSSNSRPIWESELLGWPTEFSAREMDFFDLEELEEKRSGWIQ